MRRFCAGSTRAIDDGYTGAPFDIPEYETFGMGLEVVELVGAVVDGKELGKFLSRMPRLKTFRLSYETKWHGCGHDFDAAAAMTAIEDAVGDQLEELSFSILNCYGEVETRVDSMKKFTKLRKLELDIGVVIWGLYEGDQTAMLLDEVPVLGDLLPPSVESLHLLADHVNAHNHTFARLFSRIDADVEKLPNLKRIVIRTFAEDPSEQSSSGTDVGSWKDTNVQGWKADLKALEPSVEVEFVEVNGDTLGWN
jgi:hypothetical protein